MMNNNKILTVSYGTFSCTLEGFDDSFGTMKAIAEYFRDLAADDRYFGAEPPQPDAEMLTRIAEREISRRVQAREHEGRIVLRASHDAAPIAPAATSPSAPTILQNDAPAHLSAALAPTAANVAAATATFEQTHHSAVAAQDDVARDSNFARPVAGDAPRSEPDERSATQSAPDMGAPAPDAKGTPLDVERQPDAIADTPQVSDTRTETAMQDIASVSDVTESSDDGIDQDALEASEDEKLTTHAEETPAPAGNDASESDAPIEVPDEDAAEGTFLESADAAETHHDADADFAPLVANYDASQDASAADAPADSASQDNAPEAELEQIADHAAPDSIAAKLQRIRAVVSQSQQEDEDEDLFEDEHAEALDATAGTAKDMYLVSDTSGSADEPHGDVVLDAARDIEDAQDIDDAAQEAADAHAGDDEVDEISAILAGYDTGWANAPADAVAQIDERDANTDATEVAESDAEQVIEEVTDHSDVTAAASDEEEFDEGDADLGLDSLAALMAADEDQIDADDVGENIFDQDEVDADEVDADVLQSRRARILKVKRADIDAALARGQIEEVDDAENVMQSRSSTLSEMEEADLMAELAEVEADSSSEDGSNTQAAAGVDEDSDDTDAVAAEADEDQDDAWIEAEAEDEDTALQVASDDEDDAITAQDDEDFDDEDMSDDDDHAVDDDDVSRLMAEADNQMHEPESTSRRSAFAHLKAAVMAKKADSAIGNDSIKSEGAFRSDLASVVKPRRPETSGARSERPEGMRPAPLKLVAEQRVDVDALPKGPVRPRRVASVEDVAQDPSADGSFADYAADMGAHDLPDLLEAAASYLSFVEGRDQFSRPQLMNKVRQVEKDDFSREDGLRSFGQLLRAGKIEKMKGGRFSVTDDIGYRPDHRAAG